MAFDQHIEADQIDDFNLFSALVSAPLWILGGVLGGKSHLKERTPIHKLDDNIDENSPPGSDCGSPSRVGLVMEWNTSTKECDRLRMRSGRFDGSLVDAGGPPGLRQAKNLSWSDESGKSLVEYNDEVRVTQVRPQYRPL